MTSAPIHRTTARVVPVDADGQVLLLRGHDPARPDDDYWFTIGGAVEPGESREQAAVRELREETGIELPLGELGTPFHVGRHDFTYDGVDFTSDSSFFAVAMEDVEVVFDGVQEGEIITGARWWDPASLVDAATSSLHLPELMVRAVEHVHGLVR